MTPYTVSVPPHKSCQTQEMIYRNRKVRSAQQIHLSEYPHQYSSNYVHSQEKDTGKYIRRERYAGSCERSFYVGEDITEEDIKGEFKHGILKLFVPKKEAKAAVPERKFIAIEG